MNKRTKTLLFLWKTASISVIALAASAVTLMVTGFGVLGTEPLWPWFLLASVAMFAFRYAFYWSLRRDQNALAGEAESVEKPK